MGEEDVQCYGVHLPKSSSAFSPCLLSNGKQGRDPLLCPACVCRFAAAVKTVSQPRGVPTFTVVYHILLGMMRDTFVRLGCLLGLTKTLRITVFFFPHRFFNS